MNDSKTLIKTAQKLLNTGYPEKALSVYIKITESDSDNAKGWFMRGILGAKFGSTDDAIESINRALTNDPMYFEAYLALANIHNQSDNQKEAKNLLLRMVELWPERIEAWVNLGNALEITNDHRDAAECFERAIQLAPESAMYHFQLGCQHIAMENAGEAERHLLNALEIEPTIESAQFQLARLLHKKSDWNGAASRYHEAVRLRPDNAQAWFYLGLVMEKKANLAEAEKSYQKVLAISENSSRKKIKAHAKLQLSGIYIEQEKRQEAAELLKELIDVIPENAAAIHLLSVVGETPTPERCSDEFVTTLFDGFADDFDSLLVNKLDYHIPELIFDKVKSGLDSDSGSELTILDLGCGTGLCGSLLQPLSDNLIGIDLSLKMLDVARQKNVYNSLLTGDILKVMRGLDINFNVIVSADVFIYIGALDKVFTECKRILIPEGVFIFSIETCSDEEKYQLRGSGRYAHNPAYIRSMTKTQGFKELNAVETTIRNESKVPIPGMVFTLRA